jgi:hypothetical protein
MRGVGPVLGLWLLVGCDGGSLPPSVGTDAGPRPDAKPPQGQGDEPRGSVAINEIATEPPTGPDWIELRLPASQTTAVDLSGWFLTDLPDRLDHFYRFPAGTSLAPGEYLVVIADDSKAGDGHHAPFQLAREDAVHLLDPDGAVVDAVLFLGADDGRALARVPDGAGRFFLRAPSPAARNPEVAP